MMWRLFSAPVSGLASRRTKYAATTASTQTSSRLGKFSSVSQPEYTSAATAAAMPAATAAAILPCPCGSGCGGGVCGRLLRPSQ